MNTNCYDQPVMREPGTPTKVYRLAATFAEDHWGRDLGTTTDAVLEYKGKIVIVEMDADGYYEMLSDAEHYAGDDGGFDPEYRYLMQSAARVVKALRKVGAPEVTA